MEKIMNKISELGGISKIATEHEINKAEKELGFEFSDEYRDFLLNVGTVACGATEIYGLGVKDNYHLNIKEMIKDLNSYHHKLPKEAVPIAEVGDAQYYLYDNQSKKIKVWSAATGDILEELDDNLNEFLFKLISE